VPRVHHPDRSRGGVEDALAVRVQRLPGGQPEQTEQRAPRGRGLREDDGERMRIEFVVLGAPRAALSSLAAAALVGAGGPDERAGHAGRGEGVEKRRPSQHRLAGRVALPSSSPTNSPPFLSLILPT
jgi:hypothetical protein